MEDKKDKEKSEVDKPTSDKKENPNRVINDHIADVMNIKKKK